MLTIDLLYAILQGLPPKYTEFLSDYWASFCWSIYQALENGEDPALALIIAFEKAGWRQRAAIQKTLRELFSVMHLADLSPREKEALAALRYSKAASLSQLSSILQQDRSNTFRRLNNLVKKGYAIKFFQPAGVFYMAIAKPLGKQTKLAVNGILASLLKDLAETALPTTPTTATTATTPTIPTTPSPALFVHRDAESPFSSSKTGKVFIGPSS